MRRRVSIITAVLFFAMIIFSTYAVDIAPGEPTKVEKHETVERVMEVACKCATFDEDTGRYDCEVSGSGCMYLMPNSKRCAEEYGEGPDAQEDHEVE